MPKYTGKWCIYVEGCVMISAQAAIYEEEDDTWLHYADAVSNCLKRCERAAQYEEMRRDVGDGQHLMMRCEIAGASQPSFLVVDDIVTFNWLMDKLDDPWDYLVSIQPTIVAMDVRDLS